MLVERAHTPKKYKSLTDNTRLKGGCIIWIYRTHSTSFIQNDHPSRTDSTETTTHIKNI